MYDIGVFTFHNVSINTTIADSFVQEFCLNLHSTMFLLIHKDEQQMTHQSLIYIPQCFY